MVDIPLRDDPTTSLARIHQDCDAGPFEAVYWGSHPDADNDDCWTSYKFPTAEAATQFAESADCRDTMWIEVTRDTGEVTPEGWIVLERLSLHRNPNYREEKDSNDWLEEQAMQAGMAFGVDGYNDVKGY